MTTISPMGGRPREPALSEVEGPSRAKLGNRLRVGQSTGPLEVTFVRTIAFGFCAQKDTIHSVKAYRIERIKGGMKFNCTRCTHSVSTLDFDAKAGNLRTQAATAINDHASKSHHEPLVVSAADSQQRSWR